MKLAFAKVTSAAERLLARGSGKTHWHSEIEFSDGRRFCACPANGVGWYSVDGEYDLIGTPVTVEQEQKIRQACEAMKGQRYDFLGYFTGKPHEGSKWCAEVCILAYQSAGLLQGLSVEGVHSSQLFEYLNREQHSLPGLPEGPNRLVKESWYQEAKNAMEVVEGLYTLLHTSKSIEIRGKKGNMSLVAEEHLIGAEKKNQIVVGIDFADCIQEVLFVK